MTKVPALKVQVAAVKEAKGATDAMEYVIASPSSSTNELAGIVYEQA